MKANNAEQNSIIYPGVHLRHFMGQFQPSKENKILYAVMQYLGCKIWRNPREFHFIEREISYVAIVATIHVRSLS